LEGPDGTLSPSDCLQKSLESFGSKQVAWHREVPLTVLYVIKFLLTINKYFSKK